MVCPFKPPYQAPKDRLKFPMSPSPQQEHILTRYKIGLQGKPCLILALASWARHLQLAQSTSVSSVYFLNEDSPVLLSTFWLPVMRQNRKPGKCLTARQSFQFAPLFAMIVDPVESTELVELRITSTYMIDAYDGVGESHPV